MPNQEDKEWLNKSKEALKEAFEGGKSPWIKQSKSITFDYEAQHNLPEHVKAKMQADRFSSQPENKAIISKIESILNDYRKQEDFSDYRLAAYIVKKFNQ